MPKQSGLTIEKEHPKQNRRFKTWGLG